MSLSPPWSRRTGRPRAAVTLAAVGAALVMLGAGAGLPAATAAPAAYHGSAEGLIAFVRGGNVFTIRPDGTGPRQLTTDGHSGGPRWSPDGARLAYVDRGNVWIMNANGSRKTQVASAAPAFTDARPSWSPNGRYLAFVKTRQHHASGFLTRYDTMRHTFASFTTKFNGRVIGISALPAAVAWTWATRPVGDAGSFIVYEGARPLCGSPFKYCLNLLGFARQGQFANGFPSLEFGHKTRVRMSDPDWFPFMTDFATSLMTTVKNCAHLPCTHLGLLLTIPVPPANPTPAPPGAHEGVYSPTGQHIAYVLSARGVERIYTLARDPLTRSVPVFLTQGTEPDWQPLNPPPAA